MKMENILIISLCTIWFFIVFYTSSLTIKINEQEIHIQNLEEKVNILTKEYENYALEDSLNQRR